MKKVIQFSYKFDGVPADAPVVIDCRMIRNPWVSGHFQTPEHRKTKVRNDPNFEKAVGLALSALEKVDTVAVGCYYGRDRSVTVAEEVKKRVPSVEVLWRAVRE